MLPAQVSYWTLQENKRHNQESERLGWSNYEEVKRHNEASENISLQQLDEVKRHNIATEDVSVGNLMENQRHNMMTEGVANQQLEVNKYSAMKTAGYQSAMAGASYMQAEAAQTQAKVALMNQPSQAGLNEANAYRAKAEGQSTISNIDVPKQNVDINKMNAETNLMNANTNAFNAETRHTDMMWSNVNGSVNAGANLIRSGTELFKTQFDILSKIGVLGN